MSQLDAKELGRENLSAGAFPANFRSDFRIYFAPQAHDGILQHAHQDHSVEICGILVGQWQQDENGPFATIENFIRCDSATSKFAEVTFTHESWAKINEEMDSKFDDKRIVGWYHSHPDFGIFLSERDCFIHEHFFGGPGQVAFVVDPVRQLEGVFAWKNGKPSPMEHYWIGNLVRTVQASVSKPAGGDSERGSTGDPIRAPTASAGRDQVRDLPLSVTVLCSIAIFLLGYLAAGSQRDWERQAIVDGVVSKYTNFKMAKIGLKDELVNVQDHLATTTRALEMTPITVDDISEEERKELNNVRKLIINNLLSVQDTLSRVSDRYALSEYELRALSRLQQEMSATRAASESETSKTAAQTPTTEHPSSPVAQKAREENKHSVTPNDSTAERPAGADKQSGEPSPAEED